MSAFMNNVAVAALMLPVIMDTARRTGHAPSRLLMPLAYGSLLGGLTTLIGTPPNILVSDALRAFAPFDYTSAGAFVMIAGVAFVVLAGRHLLPKRDVRKESSTSGRLDLLRAYEFENRLFRLSGQVLDAVGKDPGANSLAVIAWFKCGSHHAR